MNFILNHHKNLQYMEMKKGIVVNTDVRQLENDNEQNTLVPTFEMHFLHHQHLHCLEVEPTARLD